MDINFILLLLLIVILFFLLKISNDIKKGFDSIKSRQDYIENKIDDLK
jgi:F0F1-type ATP synthase membrane subunit b/b'